MKHKTEKPTATDMRRALEEIAKMGEGLKPSIIDWNNIGRNAVYTAKRALMENCPTCKRKYSAE